jgi:hypothetical protein
MKLRQLKNLVLLVSLGAVFGNANAQVNNPIENIPDTAGFKPGGKISGYVFGDYAYFNHSDAQAAIRGNGYTYTPYNNGISTTGAATPYPYPQNSSTFEFRRIYLGYDYNFAPKFSTQLMLAHEDTKDNLDLGGNRTFYIKYASVRWKGVYPGADLIVGQQQTPGFVYSSEMLWGYRCIEKTITDLHNLISSTDLGVAINGRIDKAQNFGYDVMIGNNRGAALPNLAANPFKRFYGDIWGRFLDKKLTVQLYSDYVKTADPMGTNRNYFNLTYKFFAAYSVERFTVGVEYFRQNYNNNFQYKGAALIPSDTASVAPSGLSIFGRVKLIKNALSAYAMYDMYTQDNNYNDAKQNPAITGFKYSVYSGNYNETLLVAGLDWTPTKNRNIHLMPNVWYYDFANKASGVSGTLKNDYYLVPRLTFYYTFNRGPMMDTYR